MNRLRIFGTGAALVALLLGACDEPCEETPEQGGNQGEEDLAVCPPLPEGVEPIEGVRTAYALDRFGGLVITISDRDLVCGDPAAQHQYCGDADGVQVGLRAEEVQIGAQPLDYPLFIEWETSEGQLYVGAGTPSGVFEIYEITDTCVTGRIAGLPAAGGPALDGGFRAPRCAS